MIQNNQIIAAIEDVSNSFDGKQLLSSINMNLQQSKILSVLGANGLDKTTLINTMIKKN